MGTKRKPGADVGQSGSKWVPDSIADEKVRVKAAFMAVVFVAGAALGAGVAHKLQRPLPPPHYALTVKLEPADTEIELTAPEHGRVKVCSVTTLDNVNPGCSCNLKKE